MFDLLKIVSNVCKEHDIEYWLDGGTLLGAIRHSGFIPWDDDVDICVPIDQYSALLDILEERFKDNERYSLMYRSQGKSNLYWSEYFCDMSMEVMDRTGVRRPCRIDITPMKFLSKNELDHDNKMTNTAAFYVLGIVKYKDFFPSELLNDSLTTSIHKKGIFLSKFWKHIEGLSKSKERTCVTYSYSDFLFMKNRRNFQVSRIYPLKEEVFNNHSFSVPSDSQYYLEVLYGEKYLELPPESQQKTFNKKFLFSSFDQSSLSLKNYVNMQIKSFYMRRQKSYIFRRGISTLRYGGISVFMKKLTSLVNSDVRH